MCPAGLGLMEWSHRAPVLQAGLAARLPLNEEESLLHGMCV